MISRRRFLAGAAGSLAAGQDSAGLHLEARPAVLDLAGRWARLLTFNGQIPGPRLEARAGDQIRLRLSNSLSEPANLHFHGLHISPAGRADNVMLRVPPGEQFDYEFEIPADHRGGTFWYHPHVHGLAARQVAGGLAGVFVVRGALDEIPEIAAASEEFVVLQDWDLTRGGEPRQPGGMERMLGRRGPLLTVNGHLNPVFAAQRGGWTRLRVLNASASRVYRLGVEEHPLFVVAVDGGPLPAPAGAADVTLAPGERVELMINAIRPLGEYRLRDLLSGSTLATIRYDGEAAAIYSLPERLAADERLPPGTPRRWVLGQGMGMGMGMGRGMGFTINGRSFDPERIDARVALGSVEDWEFVNPTAMDHPMHIHTNPVQVLDADGQPRDGWKDVILVPAGSRAKVRARFADFQGVAMLHCHILDHEDLGMMATVEIS